MTNSEKLTQWCRNVKINIETISKDKTKSQKLMEEYDALSFIDTNPIHTLMAHSIYKNLKYITTELKKRDAKKILEETMF